MRQKAKKNTGKCKYIDILACKNGLLLVFLQLALNLACVIIVNWFSILRNVHVSLV